MSKKIIIIGLENTYTIYENNVTRIDALLKVVGREVSMSRILKLSQCKLRRTQKNADSYVEIRIRRETVNIFRSILEHTNAGLKQCPQVTMV